MKVDHFLRGLVLVCLCVLVFTSKDSRKKRRGCKCMQKFLKDVDRIIERKMQKFEEKYLYPDNKVHSGNRSGLLSKENMRWLKLSSDVHYTKESLQKLSKNLQFVSEQMKSQSRDTAAVNQHFNELNMHVQNLTGVVERMEKLMPDQEQVLTETSTLPAPTLEPTYPRHCNEVYKKGGMKFEGDYNIMVKPDIAKTPYKVVCRSFNNSGWIVFQRRQDGSVDFYKNWNAYKNGFGDHYTEFWLGNDHLHELTSQGPTMLRIELQDWDGKTYTATYNNFLVDDEKKLYRLHVSGFHGNAGDSMTSHWENHDGMAFSTKDRDNDGRYYDSCAHHYHGAWWFNNCFDSHLNGKYYTKGFHRNYFQRDGIQWNSIHQYSSLKRVEMMLKPADGVTQTKKISNDV